MSLTSCLKKAGDAISTADRAGVLSRARELRAQGLDTKAAAMQAVQDRLASVDAELRPLSQAQFKRPPDVAQEPQKDYPEGYETDLFGDPVPRPEGIPATGGAGPARARPQRAGVPGNVQPEGSVQRRDAAHGAPGEFYVDTYVATPVRRELGARVIENPADLAAATRYLYDSAVERFDAIVTDRKGKPLAVVGSFKGALGQTSVYPATVVGEAIRVPGAAHIWFSHNHPSGNPQLSRADEQLDATLSEVFRGSGIEAMGIIAVGNGRYGYHSVEHQQFPEQSGLTHSIPQASGSAKVPVYERNQRDDRVAKRPIGSPGEAKTTAQEFYAKAQGPGMLLLDSQNAVSGWVPLDGLLTGKLRGTGGLRALYAAASRGNFASVIFVHGGELDAKSAEIGHQDPVMNIGAALRAVDVRVLDAINVNANGAGRVESRAERGLDLAGHTAYARGEGAQRRGEEPTPASLRGPRVTQVQQAVDEIAAHWKNPPEITVVQTAADLPGDNPPDVRGLYQRGHVWIVAGAGEHQTRSGIARTLAHEAVAHYGLRDMLGREGWTQLMNNIQMGVKAGNRELRRIQASVQETYRNEDGSYSFENKPISEADEIAAKAVEEAIDADGNFRPGFGFLKSAWAKVAQFLRDLGLNVHFTNAELQGMLVHSMRNLEAGQRTAGGGQLAVAAAREDGAMHARSTTARGIPSEQEQPREEEQPAKPREPYKGPGADMLHAARDAIGRLTHDLSLAITPMSAGTDAARAVAKDYANAERLARAQWIRFDEILKKNFTEAERRQMWEAADEQNVLLQEGKSTEGKGLDRLTPAQRETVETLHDYGEQLLQRAKDVGMFKGEGLPYWTPRMAVMIGGDGEFAKIPGEGKQATADGKGYNISKNAASLKQRKYLTADETEAAASALAKERGGQGAQLVRDIRAMPMAMARLERAIAGRELINQIRTIGAATFNPTVSSSSGPNFFTLDHPAFKTMVARQVPFRTSEYFDRKLMDGLTQLADNLGIQHERKGALKGGSLGLAYRNKPLVQTKFFTPDQVLTHEIGHQIDFKYGLAEQLTRRGVTAKELRSLADLRMEGQESEASDYYKTYVRKASEKIANLVHAYVHNPERFREVAPATFKWFDDFVERTPELAPLKELGPSLTIGSRDVEGKVTQWEERPVYISKDFEGPLKAIMAERSGDFYKAMMALKSKTMGLIMYSPLIHNAVEWGRALPIMPGKVLTFRVYFEGNRIKNDPVQMAQAISDGMVPIGHRGGVQDITGLMEEPNLAPGRSLTAKLLGGAIGLAHEGSGVAVKKGVDAAGDFWHNTLLWDRVGDLQAGLYGNIRGDLLRRGMDERTAGRLAAHFANRYAGALPNEAMSVNARKIANFVLFSRSFTLGNLGVMKDMVTGFPADIAAQIQRDAGDLALRTARSVARRKAIAAFSLDIALMYAGNSLLQSALDVLKRDKTLEEVLHGYAERFDELVNRVKENPLQVLSSPFESLGSLTPNSRNEPGKEERILYGDDSNGTNIYMRLPTGKIGEEFKDWLSSPLQVLLRKQGTFMRPLTQTITNDKGFGQRVYNPDDETWGGIVKNVGRIVWNFMSQQVPLDSIRSGVDWASGTGTDVDKLKVLGPLAGVTFSKGAPGGPQVGEMYHENRVHDGLVADVMPDVKRALKDGDEDQARVLMESVNMTQSEIRRVIRHEDNPETRLTPGALKHYRKHASEESKQRMDELGGR